MYQTLTSASLVVVMGQSNLCNNPTGIRPICIPYTCFTPPIIECPISSEQPIESPLCDFLPTIISITDLFVNLPFLLLFVVSFPARFLYCLTYYFLANANQLFDAIIYYLIYPFFDFQFLPFIYFTLGFNNGLFNQFNLPNQAYGFLNACFFSSIIKDIYIRLGDFFYIIGFAIGFIYEILVKLTNFLIDLPCYLAYFTIEVGVSYCATIGFYTFSNCYTIQFQPFSFLQGIVCKFINCQCALGSCPGISLNIYIPINCSAPPCPTYSPEPYCMAQNLTYPVQGTGEISPTTSTPCSYYVSNLNICQECLESSENCDLCLYYLQQIQENGCFYKCSQYYCLITQVCSQCSENNENACTICSELINTCYLSGNISGLPCYSEFNTVCNECYESFSGLTYNTQVCSECFCIANECKLLKAYQECPPSSETSETPCCSAKSTACYLCYSTNNTAMCNLCSELEQKCS